MSGDGVFLAAPCILVACTSICYAVAIAAVYGKKFAAILMKLLG